MSALVGSYSKRLTAAQNLFNMGDTSQSLLIVNSLLLENPNYFESQFLAALIYATDGNYHQAILHFEQSLTLSNKIENLLNIHLNLAQCYLFLNDINSAIMEYKENLELHNNHLSSWNGLAECYTRLGKQADASNAYQQVIRNSDIKSNSFVKSIAYQALTEINDNLSVTISDFSMVFLKQLNQDIQLCADQSSLVNLYFSLAKLHERQQRYQVAFENYEKANKLKSRLLNYQHKTIKQHALRTINFFNEAIFQKYNLSEIVESSPIFIVGLPRSNSTLVESLLNCSSNARALGETNIIPELIQRINSDNRYPEIIADLSRDEINNLRNHIVIKYQLDSQATIIDKLPANFWNIGLIKLLFPKSKIVHCYKPPIEACLSLFRQNFLEGHPYAYSLKDSADYYDLQIELMDHWKSLFPNQIYSLNYEDFINNPEQQAIKIFDYCQLEWDSIYLSEYINRKNVTTASSFQVRTEIHSKSNNLVRQYLPQIEYLIQRYPQSL